MDHSNSLNGSLFGSGSGHSNVSASSPSHSGQGQGDLNRRQRLKELVRPIFQESYFTAEYCLLGAVQTNQPNKLSGLYAIPSAKSAFLWFAVLFVHSGPWQGGVFRFILKFPENFPENSVQNNLPVIQFTAAYPKSHPLIHPSKGTFDIKRYYKAYVKSSHHIWQLLKCIRKTFYKLDIVEGGLYANKNAAQLFLRGQEEFAKKCDVDVQNSKARMYDDDTPYSNDLNYIRFSREFTKTEGVAETSNLSSGIGLSFMSTVS